MPSDLSRAELVYTEDAYMTKTSPSVLERKVWAPVIVVFLTAGKVRARLKYLLRP